MHTVERRVEHERPWQQISAQRISSVLDMPLSKAAEKLGVQRTALKKAYRRRASGQPWVGTPGLRTPQMVSAARHAEGAKTAATGGLTHSQQLQEIIGSRPVPPRAEWERQRSTIPLQAGIQVCENKDEALGFRAFGLPPAFARTGDDGGEEDEQEGKERTVEQMAREPDTTGIPDFLSGPLDSMQSGDDSLPRPPAEPRPPARRQSDEVAEKVVDSGPGEPTEVSWSPGAPRPQKPKERSKVHALLNESADLPLQRLSRGTKRTSCMTIHADGPVRNLQFPTPPQDAAKRPRGHQVQETVNLLLQTLSRRELHRLKAAAVTSADNAAGLPKLPAIISKSERRQPAQGGGAQAGPGKGVCDSHTSWEQLNLWCGKLVRRSLLLAPCPCLML